MGDGKVVDSMIHDGLWCAFEDCHMGIAGEVVAERVQRRRASEQDATPRESHRKAAHATGEGWFKDEILPVPIPQRKGAPIVDRQRRGDPRATRRGGARKAQAGLQQGRHGHGRQRAGRQRWRRRAGRHGRRDARRRSACTPMARIVGQATSGLAPKLVMMTPVEAVRKVAAKAGWTLEDVDLFELNEAFAVQAVALSRELGIDAAKVNVNGGAVALGHAIGASGARVLTTLLYALKRRNAEARHRRTLSWRRQRRGARDRTPVV